MHPRRERQSTVVFAGGKDFSPARGFSLLELLLVLGIMLVLGGLMYGTNSRSRQRAMQASCQKNLQTIALALQVYSGDFQSAFPLVKSATTAEEPLSLLVPKYTSATEPFICPGTKDAALPEAEPFKERRISYAYYTGWRATNSTAAADALVTDRQINTLPKAVGQPLFSADGKGPGRNHSKFGGNILFIDGHAETVPVITPINLIPPAGVALLNPRSP
jgi:prepilin-type N-terminal cleavage/methylation domain-containing protein/prepilin-type processing-associated H-X9-DG protein